MNQTPLQKSIAEINKLYADIHYGSISTVGVLNICKEILTANLEYEREEIEKAYNQGHFDGNDGCEMDFDDYYTKTYEHERKD